MKKTSFAIALVAVAVIVALLADRAWMKQHKSLLAARTDKAKAGGDDAPNVTFKDLQGNDVRLSDYKGKVVLVNFWATWCEPCQIEIPWLIEFQQKYSARGFTVLGIAMDEEGARVVQPFVAKPQFEVDGKKEAMNYPIVLGNEAIVDKFGGILGYPTSYLITRDGKIAKHIMGLVSPEHYSKEIEGLLK